MPAEPIVTFEKLPDGLHVVKVGPIDWLSIKEMMASHRDWIQDESSATQGKYTIIQSSDYDGNRFLNYYFEDVTTAFNFKIRWG
ncbi:MAG: hypothetical protein EOP83_29615 [Verrucomicrobiaceae bacterium]|nr:MAG: hypothetical protein EOP83_29615 [Verrucomicrobiaceae bacterium]